MVAVPFDGQRQILRERLAAGQAVEQRGGEGHLGMQGQGLARWQLIVGRVAFPFDGGKGVANKRFQQLLGDALAVAAVGHDDDGALGPGEGGGLVAEALGVAFLEEDLAVV